MTTFYRLSGAGNDFLALVEPEAPPAADRIRAWCARGVSEGADGLFLLHREPDGARMVHFNADGGRAALCVNGVRCAARLALQLEWSGPRLTIRTDAATIVARSAGSDRIELELPPPGDVPDPVALAVRDRRVEGWRIVVGVPHLVLPWEDDLGTAPVATLGPLLRSHPDLGTGGANVDFVRFAAPGRLEIRTWERGVEAETLSCGSGVLAAAAVGVAADRLTLPAEALTLGGFPFRLDGTQRRGRIERWTLTGDARLVARGELLEGAVPSPPARGWS